MFFVITNICTTLFIIIIVKSTKIPVNIRFLFFLVTYIVFISCIRNMSAIFSWLMLGNMGIDRNVISQNLANILLKQNINFHNNFEIIPNNIKKIYLVNYPSNEIEYLAMRLLPETVCGIAATSFTGKLIKLSGSPDNYILFPLHSGNTYNYLKRKIKNTIPNKSIWGYIENVKKRITSKRTALPLRTGLISIAKELNIPITPIYVSCVKHQFGMITSKNFRMIADETRYVTNLNTTIKELKKFFNSCKQKYD